VTPSYTQHVPGMKSGVFSELNYHPSSDCFDNPFPYTVAAYADLNCGTLTAGPLEPYRTQFLSQSNVGTFIERTPKWVVLQLPLTESRARIRFGDRDDEWIEIAEGGSVLIGNERAIDIEERTDMREEPAVTFSLYYQLAGQDLYDPPLPAKVEVPLNGCSVTNWP
jgi:hypothetical protein